MDAVTRLRQVQDIAVDVKYCEGLPDQVSRWAQLEEPPRGACVGASTAVGRTSGDVAVGPDRSLGCACLGPANGTMHRNNHTEAESMSNFGVHLAKPRTCCVTNMLVPQTYPGGSLAAEGG